ncbi:MAG: carboxypeptidase regulatory-like domain-containing protein [Planctomycetia bacterium]
MRPLARVGLLLLVLAAAGAAAWLLLGQGGSDDGLGGDGRDEAGSAAGPDASAGGGPGLQPGEVRERPLRPGGAGGEGPKAPPCRPEEGVSGIVLDSRRQPVAGARVTLHAAPANAWWVTPDRAPLAEAPSAADGTFLVGPAPAGRIKVRAEAKGYAPGIAVLASRGGRVEVLLDVGGSLVVTVVDAKGARVPGAAVQHLSPGWGNVVVCEATTGPEGIAQLPDVPTGAGQVIVLKAGQGMVRQPEVGIAPGKVTETTVVLQGVRSLTGRVLDAETQRPVTGARVTVAYPFVPGLESPSAASTDTEGRYTLPVEVPVGEQFEVGAQHEAYGTRVAWLNFNETRPGVMQHDITLASALPPIVGLVQGRDGGPVAGATVTYGGQMPHMKPPSATTDAEGRFELAAPTWLEPGTQAWVVAMHPREGVGHGNAQAARRGEARPKEVVLRLAGQGTVAGSVADGAGQPVGGATVTLAPDWEAMRRAMREGRGGDWQGINLLNDPLVQGRLVAVSDAGGAFSIEGVPLGAFVATAQWGALAASSETALAVRPGETVRTSLVLSEGGTIAGSVQDDGGQPIAGAMVWAQPAEGRNRRAATYPSTRTQADGRFELRGLSAGGWQLQAHASGFAAGSQVPAEAGARDVLLPLKRQAWLEGEVLLQGQPYAGTFAVTLKRRPGPDGKNRRDEGNWGGTEQQQFNHPEGRFTCRGLQGGEYVVGASTTDGLVALEEVVVRVVDGQGAGPVRLRLEAGATLRVSVEAAGGGPLKGAWIYAQPLPGQSSGGDGSARSDEAGQAFLRGLGSGTYRITVGTEQGVTWNETVELARGGETTLRMAERRPGRVRIVVLDAAGQPQARVRPMLLDSAGNEQHPNWQLLQADGLIDGRSQDAWLRVTTTDSSGALLRHHVPPGRYRVTAFREGNELAAEPAEVDVASGATSEVTLRLKPGG